MADFRHISKSLSQINKSHKGTSKGKAAGGKVEVSQTPLSNSVDPQPYDWQGKLGKSRQASEI